MALDRILYDVIPFTRDLDQLGDLFYVERLVVEANTNSLSVIPSLTFETGSVAFPSFSGSVRTFHETTINRLGPLRQLELDTIAGVDYFGVELFIRPVTLGVLIVDAGAAENFPGRTSDVDTSIIFDVQPFGRVENARHINPIPKRIYLDIETGTETITPTLNYDGGGSQALTAITASSRTIVEQMVLTSNRVSNITLAGNFSSSDVILYGIEMDAYIPSSRRTAIG